MSEATERIRALEDLDVIVDADGHVIEDLEDILEHMHPKYEGVKRRIRQSSKPLSNVYQLSWPAPPTTNYYGSGSTLDVDKATGPEKVEDDMADFGIDHTIVDPGLNQALSTVSNTRFAVALGNAYNTWLCQEVIDTYENVYPTMVVAPQMPEKAAEEIDRMADSGVVGITLPTGGLIPPAGNHIYDPIYEAAEKHDLPVLLHPNSGDGTAFPAQSHHTETFVETHAVQFPFQLMWHITTLVMQGIPERFPNLRFIAQEAGISWIPYLIWRLDDHYLEYPDETPFLTKPPSEYIRDQFYFTTQPIGKVGRSEQLAQMIEMIGPDRIMYSADLPHFDFDPPEELFNPIHRHLEDDDVRGIMGETAREVYGL